MKIVILAPANSIHTVRWVNSLAEREYQITLLTMHKPAKNKINPNVNVINLPFRAPVGYYLNFLACRTIIKRIKPDLLHTHYASGYGTLSRLIGYSPTLLSVWGSDVFEYPYQSSSKMKNIVKNLKAPQQIASTSVAMARQTESLYKPGKEIQITPFGVDVAFFKPSGQKAEDSIVTIGMVKTFEEKYGPHHFLESIPILERKLQSAGMAEIFKNVRILMVGEGKMWEELVKQTERLSIQDIVTFTGAVPHHEVPDYLNKLDIYCAPSEKESFGVAVIEASSCELPVIVSDVGGLPEVVLDGKTGYIVPNKSPEQIAEKLFLLLIDPELRKTMGKNGRKFVEETYSWEKCVDKMESIYADYK